MTDKDRTCPRCYQPVELFKNQVIKPHEDKLVCAPCPIRGMTIGEAADWVAIERRRLGLLRQPDVA